MKIFRKSCGVLLGLASLAAFVPRSEAQIQEGTTYTNHSVNFYWQPQDPGNPANSLDDISWLSFHFNWSYEVDPVTGQATLITSMDRNPGFFSLPNGEPVWIGTGFVDHIPYAVFWESMNAGAASPGYHSVNVSSDRMMRGLIFDGTGWNVQNSGDAHTITLTSSERSSGYVNWGYPDAGALNVYAGSEASISTDLVLGSYYRSTQTQAQESIQYFNMRQGSSLTITSNIGEANGPKTLSIGTDVTPMPGTPIVNPDHFVVTLSGSNSFTGGVALEGNVAPFDLATTARLNINNDHALGTGDLTIGELRFNSERGAVVLGNTSGHDITLANKLVFNSEVIAGSTGGYSVRASLGGPTVDAQNLGYSSTHNMKFTSDVILNGDRAFYVDDKGGKLEFTGMIANGSSTSALFKHGPGTLVLTGAASTYTGGTVVNGGILEVTHLANGGQASSIGASASSVRYDDSNLYLWFISGSQGVSADSLIPSIILGSGGTLRYTGNGDSTDRMIGLLPGQINPTQPSVPAGPVVPVTIDASGSGALKFTNTGSVVHLNYFNQGRNLVLTGTNTGDNTFAPSMRETGSLSNTRTQLTKDGSGTWILSGNNSHAGGTFVNAGTLILTGNNTGVGEIHVNGGILLVNGNNSAATGAVTVESLATLGGAGIIGGDTTIKSGGILSPGNSPGTLHFTQDLELSDGATLVMEIASSDTYDRLMVGGLMTFNGVMQIAFLDGYLPELGRSFDLFDLQSIAGFSNFDSIVFNAPGYSGTFDPETGLLSINAVPEPSIMVLTVCAGATFAAVRRRSRL